MTKRFATLLALLLMVSMLLGSVSFAEGADNEPANYGGLAPMADAGDPITFHIFVRDPELDPAADNPVIS
ncbi:MAG: hypothetical protein LBN04_00550, partial [Oscillospiraceae bacterium]|nr:hypothetical protein [Oscillospiraceae bacterium]